MIFSDLQQFILPYEHRPFYDIKSTQGSGKWKGAHFPVYQVPHMV